MQRGLEIGPGAAPLPNTDAVAWEWALAGACTDVPTDGRRVAYCVTWGEDALPFADNTFDEVYASHVIEHVDWRRVPQALTEVRRVLKPGCVFEVWTMNVRALVDAYLRGECGDQWRRSNQAGDPFVWFVARLHAYGPPDGDAYNWHRGQFDPPYMRRCLAAAGLVDAQLVERRTRGAGHGACEFGMLARKPEAF